MILLSNDTDTVRILPEHERLAVLDWTHDHGFSDKPAPYMPEGAWWDVENNDFVDVNPFNFQIDTSLFHTITFREDD